MFLQHFFIESRCNTKPKYAQIGDIIFVFGTTYVDGVELNIINRPALTLWALAYHKRKVCSLFTVAIKLQLFTFFMSVYCVFLYSIEVPHMFNGLSLPLTCEAEVSFVSPEILEQRMANSQ